MTAREAKRKALEALEFMAEPGNWPSAGFGFAWATLANIAGKPGLTIPPEVFQRVPDSKELRAAREVTP